MSAPVLPDSEARRRIAQDLGTSLVVVAGAGTGKTSALVERIVSLVDSGLSVRDVAAITFTEAAAAELRARARRALGTTDRADPAGGDDVDDAAICTLHAFAHRILLEHSVAAGLPPGFDVLDPVTERADFEAAFAEFLDRMLADEALEEVLVAALMLGADDRALAAVAWGLHQHWDRLDDGGEATLSARMQPPGTPVECDVQAVLDALDRALAMAGWCSGGEDKLLGFLTGTLAGARQTLAAEADRPLSALAVMSSLPKLSSTYGQKDNWKAPDGSAAVEQVRAETLAAEDARQRALAQVRDRVVDELMARLATFTLSHAAERAQRGRIGFHDLLVHARRLLRDDPTARRALRARYPRLLIDEFQDTDPLQVELAARLVNTEEDTTSVDDAVPGALFVVGDPKQSIYRFRRADIAMFERVCAEVGDELVLNANFRAAPGIIAFLNTVFEELLAADTDGQATHHALQAVRGPMTPTANRSRATQLRLAGMDPDPAAVVSFSTPPVMVMGGPAEGALADIRRAGARHIAAVAARAVSEGWSVSDPLDPSGPPRPANWSDVAVLIPTRTSLPPLEQAFDEAGVPFRLEGAALLWGSDDVGDVLCALRAADEPSDAVSVLAALRSPGLACGDDDLVTWNSAGGSWDPRAETPAGTEDHPVARAMAVLRALHHQRWWADPSDLVGLALDELASFETAFAHRRPRDHWQRLRWLADQARMFDESTGGTLHDFLAWADIQREDDGRSSTLGPPDADDDAVRVMTVHGAKGLEFPIVVVAGLERDESSGLRADPVLWDESGRAEVRMTRQLSSSGYTDLEQREKRLDALERIRVLYVALTRARDHLVLSLHHKADGRSQAARLDEICRAHPLNWRRLTELDDALGPGAPTAADPTTVDLDELARWEADMSAFSSRRAAALDERGSLRVVTASALNAHAPASGGPGTAPGGPDPGWVAAAETLRRADTGLQVGRAVHQALAALDLARATDDEVEAEARRRSAMHGVVGHNDTVLAMVRSAMASPVLRQAAGRVHHKEMYVASPVGGGIFEGFVDLVVEGDDGLDIVDYKTDRVDGPEDLVALVEHYRLQLGSYCWAVQAVSGVPVRRAVVLVLGESGAHVCELEGAELQKAMDDAAAAVGRAVA